MNRAMSFQINDAATDKTNPAVFITINENNDGTLKFLVSQQGGIIGDLRGLFFDLADESLMKSLSVTAASAASFLRIGDDAVKDLGNGANMHGLLGSDGGYDAGIAIGSAGLGKDDIQSFSFNLGASRALTLDDFANVDFGVRLTSVGTLGGSRADSSKLGETTSVAINAVNDVAIAAENIAITGNLLDNDTGKTGVNSITAWSGGALGQAISLNNTEGAILKLNADGTYTLDASATDRLSEGERFEFTFSYDAKSASADQTSSAGAVFSVTVTGKNDGPVAGNDAIATQENHAAFIGSVLVNDSDIDRLDTIAVTGWAGHQLGDKVTIENGAGATFTLKADGSYALDSSAADALSAGEVINQSFTYSLSDNHGATTTATVSAQIVGKNDGPDAKDDTAGSITEKATFSGNVLSNDSDIDRLDVLKVSALNGLALDPNSHTVTLTLDSGAQVTLLADGSYSYNTNGAFNRLLSGQTASDSFQYTVSDGNGGVDTAQVNINILGEGIAAPQNLFPSMSQDISNVVLYLDDGNSLTDVMKIKLQPEGLHIRDVDNLKVFDFIEQHAALLGKNTTLAGISIHAGQEYPNLAGADGTAPGEGAFFFLLDGDTPQVQPIGTNSHGWTSDWSRDDYPLPQQAIDMGISNSLLSQQAMSVFSYFDNGFWY